ncbi:cellulose binding domain-containing protein [Vibrio sp. PP-XX7]
MVLKNTGATAAEWHVTVEIEGTITNLWNGTWHQDGSTLTVQGLDWNKILQPGETSTSVGFCATR